MKFKEGIYENIPYEDYASIEAYRSHDLTSIDKCAYTWKFEKGLEPTPALLEGRVQHTVFLEHHNFDKEFVIEPDVDKRTSSGKQEYREFLEGVGDRTPITQALYDTCMSRRNAVADYIPSGTDKVELTLCYMWCGQPFKSRLDWYDGEYVWDLKTCRDASPRGFKNAVNSFKYFMQAALYVEACKCLQLRADGFKFLAQEKAHPYPFAIYEMSKEALAYANSKNERALSTLLRAKKENKFKPFNLEGTQTIELGDLW